MIKIAHRGNIRGPASETENNPIDIGLAISMGYDVEIDIWLKDGEIYLGHDEPKHLVDKTFIQDLKEEAWFHCKNLEALYMFTEEFPDHRFFWHEHDDYTLTSNGYIWTYPGKLISPNSILVINEKVDLSMYGDIPYGICYDYWDVE